MRGALCALLALALPNAGASAHPLAPALLELAESETGQTAVLWRTPAQLPNSIRSSFGPIFPAGCRSLGQSAVVGEGSGLSTRWQIACDGGLVGREIEIQGLAASGASALLRVQLADGRRFQKLLDANRAVFRIPLQAQRSSVFRDYTALGWRHILSGPDHLLFVFALILWVRDRRLLIWTVTAFTFGHSLTLSLAVLGWVHLPQAPVEAGIALSIGLLALELVREESSRSPGKWLSRRGRPALLASAFGLLHGLGFAGALFEIGVPQNEIPTSLLSFNIGIELGQLAFMALTLSVAAVGRRLAVLPPSWSHSLRLLPAYTIGSLAAFWFYQRLFASL